MRNRSQNVTGEKVRSQKGRKPAPDRQKEAGESPDKKGERMKLSQFVGAGAGAISMAGRYCPRRCGSNGSRWRGNAVRRRAVSKTVVGSSAPCTEKREKPNRTKTAPKQTEKRGKRAGKKGANRTLSQIVGAGALSMAGKPWGGKKKALQPGVTALAGKWEGERNGGAFDRGPEWLRTGAG